MYVARTVILCAVGLAAANAATPASASVHLMQIEKVIGGVNGDTSAQAIQLRLRSSFQSQLQLARLVAWDAAGANPIVVIDMASSVSNSSAGARVLIASAAFAAETDPTAQPDFMLTELIPASYLTAGSLTFESDGGTIYWRLSWGGAAYTGSTTGTLTNDADGEFAPPVAGPLPSSGTFALEFQGTASSRSTTNVDDYALSAGPAEFTNNSGATFTLAAAPVLSDLDGDGDGDFDDVALLAACLVGPGQFGVPAPCPEPAFDAADADHDLDVDLLDAAEFLTAFPD